MRLKSIIHEDYTNYLLPSLFLGTCFCDWKCCREAGTEVCQNSSLASYPIVEVPDREIIDGYLNNPLTHAVVIGGLEPFLQWVEMLGFISLFRKSSMDDIVIYTGYYEKEICGQIGVLREYPGIILKTGRYVPGQSPHYDEVLGVKLASDMQHGIRIS